MGIYKFELIILLNSSWVVNSLDKEASRISVTRQSIIKGMASRKVRATNG